MSRRSYSGLSKLPAWGLYVGERIIASVRAKTAEDAEEIFHRHGLTGVEVRPVGPRPPEPIRPGGES